MWWNREMLLALIVAAALHGTVNCAIELDMALDSVDDRYDGCHDAVLKKVVQSGLLRDELAANPEFQKAWTANKDCSTMVPGGLKEHGQALLAFTYGGKAFRDMFNRAVGTMGGNDSFPFQSLHFLLTDAMTLLLKKGNVCRTVYHISSQEYSAQKGANVRLGGFMTANSDLFSLREDPVLEGGVMFNITSCFALDLEKYTCMQEDVQMLLFPSAVYTVEDVRKVTENYDHTKITLKHYGFSSSHNCPSARWAQKGSSTQVLGCMWSVYLTAAVLGLLY